MPVASRTETKFLARRFVIDSEYKAPVAPANACFGWFYAAS